MSDFWPSGQDQNPGFVSTPFRPGERLRLECGTGALTLTPLLLLTKPLRPLSFLAKFQLLAVFQAFRPAVQAPFLALPSPLPWHPVCGHTIRPWRAGRNHKGRVVQLPTQCLDFLYMVVVKPLPRLRLNTALISMPGAHYFLILPVAC